MGCPVSNNSSGTSGGIGVTGALLVLFVALKLTHVINWSWWWVLSPAWIGTGIVVLFLLGVFGVGAIVVWREDRRDHRRFQRRGQR